MHLSNPSISLLIATEQQEVKHLRFRECLFSDAPWQQRVLGSCHVMSWEYLTELICQKHWKNMLDRKTKHTAQSHHVHSRQTWSFFSSLGHQTLCNCISTSPYVKCVAKHVFCLKEATWLCYKNDHWHIFGVYLFLWSLCVVYCIWFLLWQQSKYNCNWSELCLEIKIYFIWKTAYSKQPALSFIAITELAV